MKREREKVRKNYVSIDCEGRNKESLKQKPGEKKKTK